MEVDTVLSDFESSDFGEMVRLENISCSFFTSNEIPKKLYLLQL